MSTKRTERRTPSKSRDIPCTVRLPKATLALISEWQRLFGYATRTDVIKAILAMGLHTASERMDAQIAQMAV
jgi:hypothetical protein